MLLRDSRYQGARRFAPDTRDGRRFKGLRPRAIAPATGVLEHVLREGERLDLLAHHYYNDARLWWRILDANPDLSSGVELSLPENVGRVILIPAAED